jgi:protein-S-isoprenylcysteine O-methyltransferase Ste14
LGDRIAARHPGEAGADGIGETAMNETLFLRRAVVEAAVVLYWLGVVVQARRIRHRIGRSPNLRPRGLKERLLWSGWAAVITIWILQPLLTGTNALPEWLQIAPALLSTAGLIAGITLTVGGYAGTIWCYAAMGDTWRIGIDRREKNVLVSVGPYRFVRHPIYLFQIVMLGGAVLLLPGLLSVLVIVVHLVCVLIKASDEENHMLGVHGQDYREYIAKTGRLLPKWTSDRSVSTSAL